MSALLLFVDIAFVVQQAVALAKSSRAEVASKSSLIFVEDPNVASKLYVSKQIIITTEGAATIVQWICLCLPF